MLLHRSHPGLRAIALFLAVALASLCFLRAAADFDAISNQAAQARESGRLLDAVKLYRQAVELRPDWLEGLWYLGTLLYDADRHAEARDYFKKFVELSPENGPAWAFLGLCYFRTAEYEASLGSLDRARRLGLGESGQLVSVVRYHMAILLSHSGRFEDAIEALKEFALKNVRSPDILEAFGLCTLRMKWLPAEVPAERRELILKAGAAAYEAAAFRFEAAEDLFEKLIQDYPREPNVHYAFGAVLASIRGMQGLSRQEAMEQFEAELRIQPNHLPSLLQIALAHIEQGGFEEALPYVNRAIEADPNSFVARYALGQIQLAEGNLPEAIETLKQAVSLEPMSPEVRFTLARAYQKAGRDDDAARERAEFERLSKLKKATIQVLQ